jgi:hypothetical protein
MLGALFDRGQYMRVKMLITLVALVIVVGHRIWPEITIDSVTIIFLVIAILPWLAPVIKSLELPGGFKIEIQDIKSATEKVISAKKACGSASISGGGKLTATGVASRNKTDIAIAKLRNIAKDDHNLAVVGVGIEIEKKLLELAEQKGIDPSRKSLGQLVRDLQHAEALPNEVAAGLRNLITLRNQAVHGATVSSDAAKWLLDVYPSILEVLDELSSFTNEDRQRNGT